MKKLIMIMLCFLTLKAFSQPNRIEDVTLENNILYTWAKGVKTAKGFVDFTGTLRLNSNNSLMLLGSTGNGIESFGLGRNLVINGHTSFGQGTNSIIDANGSAAFGADHHIYRDANYSFVAGDANNNYGGGYSASLFGFGNTNHTEYGFVEGNDNIQGLIGVYSTGSYTGGIRNKNYGSGNFVRGKFLFANGNDITFFGYSNSPFAPVTATQAGFHIAYGQMMFQVLADGRIVINGVPYRFPTQQAAGVLTNDGNGNLSWQQPNTTQMTKQIPSGRYAAYTPTGQLLYLVRIND